MTSTDTTCDFFVALDTIRCAPDSHDDNTRVVVSAPGDSTPDASTAVHACARCVGSVAAYFDGLFGGHVVEPAQP